jgi:hypothetical protein
MATAAISKAFRTLVLRSVLFVLEEKSITNAAQLQQAPSCSRANSGGPHAFDLFSAILVARNAEGRVKRSASSLG